MVPLWPHDYRISLPYSVNPMVWFFYFIVSSDILLVNKAQKLVLQREHIALSGSVLEVHHLHNANSRRWLSD
jgi:hypothetical protein